MNNLSDIFNELFSDAFRVSVLIQIVTLGFFESLFLFRLLL